MNLLRGGEGETELNDLSNLLEFEDLNGGKCQYLED